ncbi:MAG TPA: hypothetical protein VGF99_10945 [Myxococcota bacterium]
MARLHILAVVAVLAAFCAAACSQLPAGAVCTSDDDCGELQCLASAADVGGGRCTPGDLVCTRRCERLADCDDDEVCLETCTPGVRVCIGQDAQPLPLSAVCNDRRTCAEGLSCLDNFTATICSRPCIDDGDCVGLDPDVTAVCNSNALCVAAGA